MRFCTSCGWQLDGESAAQFCSQCGTRNLAPNLPGQLASRPLLIGKHKLAVTSVAVVGIVTALVIYQIATTGMSQQEVAQWQQAGVDRPLTTLELESPATAVSFSPNGRLLVTANESGVYAWDTTTWRRSTNAWKVPSKIKSLTFSPDGSRLVTIDDRGAARILDIAGPISRAIEGVRAAVFSADSTRLTTWGEDARVWDVVTGDLIHTLAVPGSALFKEVSAVSPDGARWVAFGSDKTLKVIATATGSELRSFRVPACNLQETSVAMSADNSKILAAGESSRITIAEGCFIIMDNRGQALRLLQLSDPVLAATFSPDGSRVATTSADGTARVFDIVSGQTVYVLKDARDQAWDATAIAPAFSPDGSRLAVAGDDKRIRVWDIQTQPREQTAHRGSVIDFVFSSDGTEVVASGVETPFEKPSFRFIRAWRTSDGHAIKRMTAADDPGTGALLSSDGKKLARFAPGNGARIQNVHTEQVVRTLTDANWMSPVTFSPDGERIAAARSSLGGNHSHWAEIWEVSTGRHLLDLKAGNQKVEHCVFSPDGSTLVTDTSWPWAETVVWDAHTGFRLYDLKAGNSHVVFSRDSTKILMSLSDEENEESNHHRVQIREARSGRILRVLADSTEISAVDLSPDGSKAMIAGDDGVAHIWDVATGNLSTEFLGHTGPILGVAFSHNGSQALTTGEDRTARLWDVPSGQQLHVLAGPQGRVYGGRFSTDDSRVATVTEDRVWLWDTRTGSGFELK